MDPYTTQSKRSRSIPAGEQEDAEGMSEGRESARACILAINLLTKAEQNNARTMLN